MNQVLQGNLSPAFDQLQVELSDAGLKPQSVAFIVGRLLGIVTQAVTAEVATLQGLEQLSKINDDAEKQAMLEKLFQEQKGKTIVALRDELAQKLVDDFNSQ